MINIIIEFTFLQLCKAYRGYGDCINTYHSLLVSYIKPHMYRECNTSVLLITQTTCESKIALWSPPTPTLSTDKQNCYTYLYNNMYITTQKLHNNYYLQTTPVMTIVDKIALMCDHNNI